MERRKRNPKRHEYEVQAGSSQGGAMVFAGYIESTAVRTASELLRVGTWAERGEEYVRLYHTYPSPGPVRRFVGWIHSDGTLRRAS